MRASAVAIDMRVGIAAKIGAFSIALVLATGLSVGIVVYRATNAALVDHATGNLGDEARLRSARLLSGIAALRDDVRFLARTPPIQGIIGARRAAAVDSVGSTPEEIIWRDRLAIIFGEFLRAKSHYFQLRFIGVADGGREIVRVDRLGSQPVRMAEAGLAAKGHRYYYQAAIQLEPGEVYLSNIDLNQEHGAIVEPHQPVLRAVVAVRSAQGEVFGIVVVNMDFGLILRSASALLARGSSMYVTNDAGDFLLHPDPALAFGFDLGARWRIQQAFPALTALFAQGAHNAHISVKSGSAPDSFLLHFVKVPFDPSSPERYLGLALTANYDDIVTHSVAARNRSIVLTLVLVCIGMLLAAIFANLLTHPLNQVIAAASCVADGELDVALPVKSGDEIGTLARAFQTMLRRLRERSEALRESETLAATGRMAAGIAHQINNPLAGIKNSFLLFQDAIPADHPHRRYVPLIHGEIDRIAHIVRQMSDLYRPEREAPSQFSVGDLIDDVVVFLAPRCRQNEISVHVDLPEAIFAWLPAGSLRQLVLAVIQNAIDASPRRGSIEIRVATAGEQLTIAVTDRGSGIPEELISRVFEPFFTTKHDSQGVRPGLGLPLARGLAEAMGGSLTFDSPPGGGTVFRIELPLQDVRGGRVAAGR